VLNLLPWFEDGDGFVCRLELCWGKMKGPAFLRIYEETERSKGQTARARTQHVRCTHSVCKTCTGASDLLFKQVDTTFSKIVELETKELEL
jgi:hypothetical protein